MLSRGTLELLATGATILALWIPVARAAEPERLLRLGVKPFRGQVRTLYLPDLPKGLITGGEVRPIVAELRVNTRGKVFECSVLESPSQEIAQVVNQALRKWEFHPLRKRNGSPVSFSGRVILYVGRKGSSAVVIDPLANQPPR